MCISIFLQLSSHINVYIPKSFHFALGLDCAGIWIHSSDPLFSSSIALADIYTNQKLVYGSSVVSFILKLSIYVFCGIITNLQPIKRPCLKSALWIRGDGSKINSLKGSDLNDSWISKLLENFMCD